MSLHGLSGTTWYSHLVFYLAVAMVLLVFLENICAILYQNFIYGRIARREFDPAWRPRCAVILPAKGICKDFEHNLEEYCNLEYPDYQLVVSVESETDPAVPVIKRVAAKHARVKYIVAGLTWSCSQKNHNMLEAIKTCGDVDVYVFGDADIPPRRNWLAGMILPLSSPAITAATGFRWLLPPRGTVGELSHANVNLFIEVLFGTVSLLRLGSIVWGGSMAIRRKDFEELGVAAKWGRSGVDDISLARVLADNHRRSMLVPPCITPTDDLIETTGGTIRWTTRQVMYLKFYHRPLWLFGLGSMWILAVVLYGWLPIAAIGAALTHKTFIGLGGAAPLLFFVGDMAGTLLYRPLGAMPSFWKLPFLQPFYRFTQIIVYWNTLFARTILWSGVNYTLNYKGDVTKVERI